MSIWDYIKSSFRKEESVQFLVADDYDAINTPEGFEKLMNGEPTRTVFIPRVPHDPAKAIIEEDNK